MVRERMEKGWGSALAVAAIALLAGPGQAQMTGSSADDVVTFAEDVAPILQQKCQTCHQPGGMGPMSLMTYEEVRPWAQVIKQRVQDRVMPPWHVDKSVGIQEFKNDISLSDEQIATISAWVDGGTPLGNLAMLPPPVDWPNDSEWQLERELGRPPDLVIMSDPYTVGTTGLDQWWEPTVTIDGLDRPRWMMANETRPSPGSRAVTHHANSDIQNFGVGKPFDIYPEDTGFLITPGLEVGFNIHYFPLGEEVEDAYVEVGIWFYPDGQEPRLQTEGDYNLSSYRQLGGDESQELVIPPHSTAVTQGFHVMAHPVRIHSVRGHQHLLGVGQSIEAILPDGRVELLSKVDWKHNWHITYLYEDHVMPLLPTGTTIVITSWYDNTANNVHNPDPDQWAVHGRRTVDDMSHMWIGMTPLEEEDYTRLVAERIELLEEMGRPELISPWFTGELKGRDLRRRR